MAISLGIYPTFSDKPNWRAPASKRSEGNWASRATAILGHRPWTRMVSTGTPACSRWRHHAASNMASSAGTQHGRTHTCGGTSSYTQSAAKFVMNLLQSMVTPIWVQSAIMWVMEWTQDHRARWVVQVIFKHTLQPCVPTFCQNLISMGDLQDPKMEVLYHFSGHILWWYSLT